VPPGGFEDADLRAGPSTTLDEGAVPGAVGRVGVATSAAAPSPVAAGSLTGGATDAADDSFRGEGAFRGTARVWVAAPSGDVRAGGDLAGRLGAATSFGASASPAGDAFFEEGADFLGDAGCLGGTDFTEERASLTGGVFLGGADLLDGVGLGGILLPGRGAFAAGGG